MVLVEIAPWFIEEPDKCVLLNVFPWLSLHSFFSAPVHHANGTLSIVPLDMQHPA